MKKKKELENVHKIFQEFLAEKLDKKKEMKADVENLRRTKAYLKKDLLGEWNELDDRITEQNTKIGDELQRPASFNGYSCYGSQWFLNICVAAREKENLAISERWQYFIDTMAERVEEMETRKDEILVEYKDKSRLNWAEQKDLEKQFKTWKKTEEAKYKGYLYGNKTLIKNQHLELLNLRRSMTGVETSLDIMQEDGDFKTKDLDDTTSALNVVENALFIVSQELGNLRTYLEDFPKRLETGVLKLKTDASNYNDIIEMQEMGLDSSALEELLSLNFDLEIKNMYERILSWVLLARQSFATFNVMGNLNTNLMTNDLNVLRLAYEKAKKVATKILDQEIADMTRDIMVDNMIAQKYPEHFEFSVENMETGLEMLCEHDEGTHDLLKEPKELMQPMCDTL